MRTDDDNIIRASRSANFCKQVVACRTGDIICVSLNFQPSLGKDGLDVVNRFSKFSRALGYIAFADFVRQKDDMRLDALPRHLAHCTVPIDNNGFRAVTAAGGDK